MVRFAPDFACARRTSRSGAAVRGDLPAFVLLEQPEWDGEQFKRDLRDLWGIPCFTQETGGEDGEGALVFEADGMTAAVHLYPFPVPHGEAEENAAHNYLWPEAAESAARHRGQLLVTVLPREESVREAAILQVKLVCAACRQAGCWGLRQRHGLSAGVL